MSRLLVVDAEAEARSSVQRILAGAGHEVAVAGSGREALRLLQETRFDLVVAGFGLPDFDGLALVRRGRAIDPDVEFVLTAFATITAATTAVKYDFLARPFSPAELERVVSRALDHRDLAFENRRLRRQLDAVASPPSADGSEMESLPEEPRWAGRDAAGAAHADHIRVPIGTPLEEVERLVIGETLRRTGGNKFRAASMLGIAARTIYRKLAGEARPGRPSVRTADPPADAGGQVA